jgi:hypothetical protein
MRLNREGDNPMLELIRFYNNVWADTTGTMDDFSDTPPADVTSFELDHNLYWNDGNPIPEDDAEAVNASDDANAVLGDPGLADPRAIVLPRYREEDGEFADGSSTVCAVHERLVLDWGTPVGSSAAVDAADPEQVPADDILGRPRTEGAPDLGAVERP